MKQLNFNQLLSENTCTFEMAKKAADAGIFFLDILSFYDSDGEVHCKDTGPVSGALMDVRDKINGNNFFPAINLGYAINLLQKIKLDELKILVFCMDDPDTEGGHMPADKIYIFNYDGNVVGKNKNLVDLILQVWIDHKNKQP
jgi:hypothetical protein